MSRALVTGAGGFVGQHLCARLLAEGWEVWGTVRPGAAAPPGVRALTVDLTGPYEVPDVEVAFHLAAARTPDLSTLLVNAMSGVHLVQALPASCRAVVRLGSSTEYAEVSGPMAEDAPLQPRGFFGATKAAGSLLLTAAAAEQGLRAAVLRAFQVYGAHDKPTRFVPAVLRAAATGEVLPLTAPGLRRDWVHVDDVVSACLLAAAADDLPPGQVLNIGTGVQTANEDLVAVAREVTGRPIRTEVGAHAGRSWDAASWVADPSLARALLGWEPRLDLRAGLARTWAASS